MCIRDRFVAGYPDSLNISYSGGPPKVPAGARTEEVTRVKRVTRFHSRNLIQQGATCVLSPFLSHNESA